MAGRSLVMSIERERERTINKKGRTRLFWGPKSKPKLLHLGGWGGH